MRWLPLRAELRLELWDTWFELSLFSLTWPESGALISSLKRMIGYPGLSSKFRALSAACTDSELLEDSTSLSNREWWMTPSSPKSDPETWLLTACE